jgi:hypothetical protein
MEAIPAKQTTKSGDIYSILLRAEKRQSVLMQRLPANIKEKLNSAEGRAAELKISGKDGGLFYLKYENGRLRLLDESCEVRNKVLMTDKIFYQLVGGAITPRAAKAHRYILVSGEEEMYDSEELMQAIKDWLFEIRASLGLKVRT